MKHNKKIIIITIVVMIFTIMTCGLTACWDNADNSAPYVSKSNVDSRVFSITEALLRGTVYVTYTIINPLPYDVNVEVKATVKTRLGTVGQSKTEIVPVAANSSINKSWNYYAVGDHNVSKLTCEVVISSWSKK